MADISHTAGLIAGKQLESPIPYSDIVSTTTHKTLRGPRGAIIMCKEQFAKAINKSVFPGIQGGPHDHINAAKAVAFAEALKPEFSEYSRQVIKNAQQLAKSLQGLGYRIVSGGTDNHIVLVDLFGSKKITGKEAEKALETAGISINKNMIPYDTRKPMDPSGVRLGTPALTTRGMKEADVSVVAGFIDQVLQARDDEAELAQIKNQIKEFALKFPVPGIE